MYSFEKITLGLFKSLSRFYFFIFSSFRLLALDATWLHKLAHNQYIYIKCIHILFMHKVLDIWKIWLWFLPCTQNYTITAQGKLKKRKQNIIEHIGSRCAKKFLYLNLCVHHSKSKKHCGQYRVQYWSIFLRTNDMKHHKSKRTRLENIFVAPHLYNTE